MNSPTAPGRARLRFGRYDYAAFITFAAYAASSLAIPVVLVDMAENLRFPLLEGGMTTGGSFQIVLSCAGVPGCGFFTWLMGLAGDHFGLARSFALVPFSYLAMVALVLAAARHGR